MGRSPGSRYDGLVRQAGDGRWACAGRLVVGRGASGPDRRGGGLAAEVVPAGRGRRARPGLGVQQGQQQRQVGANNHSPLRLQWTPSGGGGSSTTDWEQITYTYDPSGRRIAKASVEMTTPASASSAGANDDSPLPQTGGLRGFIRRLPAS
ncbi:MAG: hypothetical protein GXY19_18375 [Phycisphaerae bacterium]|nr:hypothetical protein [Phycisphaerae bacterium]